MLFQRLFFSAGVKRTLTECNRNQFFFFLFYICTLFLYHHGRWNLLIRVKSRSVWHGEKKKKHEGEEEGNGNEETAEESQVEVLG